MLRSNAKVLTCQNLRNRIVEEGLLFLLSLINMRFIVNLSGLSYNFYWKVSITLWILHVLKHILIWNVTYGQYYTPVASKVETYYK